VKKVRYVVGALGMTPVLGVVTPALAAGTAGQAMAKTGKMVALAQRDVPRAPDITCTGHNPISSHKGTGKNYFEGVAFLGSSPRHGFCISGTSGWVSHFQSAMLLRTRVYVKGHYTSYLAHGKKDAFGSNSTYFVDNGINHAVSSMVCEALINSHMHSKVLYGPVCEVP